MLKGIVKSLSVGLLLAASSAPVRAESLSSVASFDFSGIDAFWEVLALLEMDKSPSAERWSILLDTPGYRALTKSEFDRSFFKENFELAFMPSREEDLAAALVGGKTAPYLDHYVQVKERREELERQVEHLKETIDIEEIIKRVRDYLPRQEEVPADAPVAFVIFANDGRGYDPIVIDLLASMTWDFEPYLAHELHHWYRNRQLSFDPERLNSADGELVWTLNQIQAEGMADQLDKRSWIVDPTGRPSKSEDYVRRYRASLEATPELLETLDSLLIRYGKAHESERSALSKEISELVPMSGHPTGFYLADLILEQLGLEALRQDVGNPFAFIRSFNQAAEKAGRNEIALSPGAMKVLSEMEGALPRPEEGNGH